MLNSMAPDHVIALDTVSLVAESRRAVGRERWGLGIL